MAAVILAVSGSLRQRSSNRTLLEAAAILAGNDVAIETYEGLAGLPHFNPDDDAEGAEPALPVAELRAAVAASAGVLISSPEYAHGVPGSLKNALDWLVSCGDLVGTRVALVNANRWSAFAQAQLKETLTVMNWEVVADLVLPEPLARGASAEEVARDAAVAAVLQQAIDALIE